MGIGTGRTYERLRKVIEQAEEEAPELAERMEAGELSAREARTDLRRRKGERRFAEAADVVIDRRHSGSSRRRTSSRRRRPESALVQ